jgi:hypothetical protein
MVWNWLFWEGGRGAGGRVVCVVLGLDLDGCGWDRGGLFKERGIGGLFGYGWGGLGFIVCLQ